MSVPAKRRASSAGKRRRSHQALKKRNFSQCPRCKKPKSPHRACGFCGYYKGREAIKIKSKKGKLTTKKEDKKSN